MAGCQAAAPPAASGEEAALQARVQAFLKDEKDDKAPPVAAVGPPQVAAVEVLVAPPCRRGNLLTTQEKRDLGRQAELYSIIVGMEHLEAAFIRGSIPNDVYEKHCTQLLAQFKTLQAALAEQVNDVREFARKNGLECPLAEERLLGTGVAATALFRTGTTSAPGNDPLACFQASENFITLNDALKLSISAVDELLPMVRDLQASVVLIQNVPKLDSVDRIAVWLGRLNGMRASDSLDSQQCRQLALDVEQAYCALKASLQTSLAP